MRTLGDQFAFEYGKSIVGQPVTPENFDQRLEWTEDWSSADAANNRDVKQLYQLVARFQLSALVDFITTQSDPETAKTLKTQYRSRIEALGYSFDEEDSAFSKLWRSATDPTYVAQKAYAKMESVSADLLRSDWVGAQFTAAVSTQILQPGFTLYNVVGPGFSGVRLVKGDHKDNARIGHEVVMGGGISNEVIDRRYDGTLVADAVGTYSTGAQKLTDMVIHRGYMVSYFFSEREGLAFFTSTGQLKILNLHDLTSDRLAAVGFTNLAPDSQLNIDIRLADFITFTSQAKRERLSVMQGHLLLYNGDIMLGSDSATARDKRRMLLDFGKDQFGLLDFGDNNITLYEAATIAKNLGAVSAMNLDTGFYDYGRIRTTSGSEIALGMRDKERSNNKIVLFEGAAPP